jgi:hypothetical protein
VSDLNSFLQKFGSGEDEQASEELVEKPGAMEAFVNRFAGNESDSFWFYENTIEIRYYPGPHQYFLVDPNLGNLTLLLNISTVSKIVDRSPALIPWTAKVTVEKLLRIIPTLTYPGTGKIVVPEMSLEDFTKIALEAKTAHSDRLEDAGEVGKMAHAWIEEYIKAVIASDVVMINGLMTSMCPDPRATACVIAALDWMKAHNVRWKETERKVYSKKHQVSGTLDGLCIVDACEDPICCPKPFKDRLSLADWKTSNYLYVEFLFQTAAYEQCYEEEFNVDIPDRWVLRLGKEDGEFQPWHLEAEDFAEDFAGFVACLELKRVVLSIEERMRRQKKDTREAKKIARVAAREIAIAEKKAAKAAEKAEAKRLKQEEKERIKAEAKETREKLRAEKKAAKETLKLSKKDADVVVQPSEHIANAVVFEVTGSVPVYEATSGRFDSSKPNLASTPKGEYEEERVVPRFSIPTEEN